MTKVLWALKALAYIVQAEKDELKPILCETNIKHLFQRQTHKNHFSQLDWKVAWLNPNPITLDWLLKHHTSMPAAASLVHQ